MHRLFFLTTLSSHASPDLTTQAQLSHPRVPLAVIYCTLVIQFNVNKEEEREEKEEKNKKKQRLSFFTF